MIQYSTIHHSTILKGSLIKVCLNLFSILQSAFLIDKNSHKILLMNFQYQNVFTIQELYQMQARYDRGPRSLLVMPSEEFLSF